MMAVQCTVYVDGVDGVSEGEWPHIAYRAPLIAADRTLIRIMRPDMEGA